MPTNPYTQSAECVLQAMNKAGSTHSPFFFALDYELQEGIFIPNPLDTNTDLAGICFRIDSWHSPDPQVQQQGIAYIKSIQAEEQSRYAQRFSIVHKGLHDGDSFLTNLTLRSPIQLSTKHLEDIYLNTKARYQVLIPQKCVCYSPEIFVRIEGNEISTYPMKGTISADVEGNDQRLLNDYKETCEHSTIVDLMRNDLNRIALGVSVRRFKYLDLLKTDKGNIWQMSSEVVGRLEEDWHSHIGDIFRTLLPAGSISGAPKRRTCEIIAEAEGYPRGYYTGVCGYYDGSRLDSGVMIRFIEQDAQGNHFYRSGGGITINSKMEEEYLECLQKIYLPK